MVPQGGMNRRTVHDHPVDEAGSRTRRGRCAPTQAHQVVHDIVHDIVHAVAIEISGQRAPDSGPRVVPTC
jgi:hypothetical protein